MGERKGRPARSVAERIEARCVVQETKPPHESGHACAVWTGYCEGPLPIISVKQEDGKYRNANVRKLLWDMYHSAALEDRQFIRMTCTTPRCVEPMHMRAMRKGEWMRLDAEFEEDSGVKIVAERMAELTAAFEKRAKLKAELRGLSLADLGRKYGVSRQRVKQLEVQWEAQTERSDG